MGTSRASKNLIYRKLKGASQAISDVSGLERMKQKIRGGVADIKRGNLLAKKGYGGNYDWSWQVARKGKGRY